MADVSLSEASNVVIRDGDHWQDSGSGEIIELLAVEPHEYFDGLQRGWVYRVVRSVTRSRRGGGGWVPEWWLLEYFTRVSDA